MAFSQERAVGEALIHYKEARLAHTGELAAAETNATAQTDAMASVNKAASNYAAERANLAPLYKASDDAQEKYDAAVERFLAKVHEYEKIWLAVYEVYITDPVVRDVDGNFPYISYGGSGGITAYHLPLKTYDYEDDIKVSGANSLLTGTTSGVAEGKGDFEIKPVNLTLLQKAVSDVEQAVVRATAANEKAQTGSSIHAAAAAVDAAISDARTATVEAYREHGISEGQAGQVFRFTDSGEDAVIYNISLNSDAEANLASFNTALNGILDDMHAAIRSAEDARDKALSAAEDTRFASIDTVDAEEQARQNWQDAENLRRRILLTDALVMSAGWGEIYGDEYARPWGGDRIFARRDYYYGNIVVPGSIHCLDNAQEPYYRTAADIGRDSYIRNYWHKEQPLDRICTVNRLAAVESVVDDLEEYLQGRIDYRREEEHRNELRYNECQEALNWFSRKKAAIVREKSVVDGHGLARGRRVVVG